MIQTSMRCLVIDDEEAPRQLISLLLERGGHQVAMVDSGDRAIDEIESDRFDLAVVDMELPGINGADTIARLRGMRPDLKILVVSGHTDRRYVLSALESGADGYLLKDDVSELLSAVLRDIAAGYTVMSPRIHTGTMRDLLRALGRPVVEARSEPRSRTDLEPVKPPA